MTMYAGVGVAEDLGGAGVVVPVGVADEQDLDVVQVEAELLDAGLRMSGGRATRGWS